MLGYSRVAAEKEGVYEVDAVVNETVAMLGRKFLAGIVLKLEIAEVLPAVRGSRGRMEQVLLRSDRQCVGGDERQGDAQPGDAVDSACHGLSAGAASGGPVCRSGGGRFRAGHSSGGGVAYL